MNNKFIKIIVIVVIIIFVILLSNMIFWSVAMQSKNGYNLSKNEEKFIENFNKKDNIYILYHNKLTNYQIIDFKINESINSLYDKNNIKKFSDSVFTEFKEVYNRKDKVDSLMFRFKSSKIDTLFIYPANK